ncbi:hypothetical protein ACIBH1_44845 [Nonomuraea sp. NPDC050663]|uniref:hypothetical protein n=1 Tax=Nonomuraea sp. NPDC050663 TaxID=3364370 RepID=UPI0037A8BFF0
MLPEIKAYYDATDGNDYYYALDRARTAHPVQDWHPTMSPEQVQAIFDAEDQLAAAVRKVDTDFKMKQAQAHHKLATHEDPLVRFLATDPEILHYPTHREVVLKALPMSREEMDVFGEGRNWCEEYERLLQRADEAGVLPPRSPDQADIDALVQELHAYTGRHGGRTERRLRALVNKHIPAILASATTVEVQSGPQGKTTRKAKAS